jgi:hypothetical protein
MHAAMHRYAFDVSLNEEIDRKINEILVPILVKVDGFVAYYWVNSGQGSGASIGVYEDRSGVEESARRVNDFADKHLPRVGKPEVTEGEVKAWIGAPYPED